MVRQFCGTGRGTIRGYAVKVPSDANSGAYCDDIDVCREPSQ